MNTEAPAPDDLLAPRNMGANQEVHTRAYLWAKGKQASYDAVGLGWNFKEASAQDGYVEGALRETEILRLQVAEQLRGLLRQTRVHEIPALQEAFNLGVLDHNARIHAAAKALHIEL